jgi:LDH2 family malate/lactate/ureidoglycolate dehydrogenase
MPTLPIDELESLAARALEMAGASPAASRAAARALVAADVPVSGFSVEESYMSIPRGFVSYCYI